MPQFILICRDKADHLELRMQTRPAHLDYVANAADVDVLVAGPMLDDKDNPCGSVFLLAAETKESVQTFAANDPYQQAGLFEETEIKPFKLVAGALVKAK